MILDPDTFAALVAEANLAPSVHNTQPTRWRQERDGTVLVLEVIDRRLAVGDPNGRDADVSHGAAIEGFSLAAAARSLSVSVAPLQRPARDGLRDVARLTLAPGGQGDTLQPYVARRRSYRGAFVAGPPANLAALAAAEDVRLAATPTGVARLARLNDQASLATYRDAALRAELVSWMRLSRRDPRWALDGLIAEALQMSAFEACGAGVVLKPGLFEALDRLGVAAALVAEAEVVRTATAIALFHRPADEPPLATGRRFYRLWLEFTRLGLSAAPMSVLADDPKSRAAIAEEFGLPTDSRLITTFRLGHVRGRVTARARLSPDQLLV